MRRLLSTIALLLFSIVALAQDGAPSEQKLYAVIFDVAVDSSGKVDTLSVVKVIDPATGTTDAVDVEVPPAFVAAVRNHLLERTYPASQEQFYTYIFYDPQQPERADIDPKAGRL